MHDDIRFISMIEAALGQRDVKAALRDTFEQIRTMGRQPRYRRNHRQFLHWMSTVAEARYQLEDRAAEAAVPASLERPPGVSLLVKRDGHVIASHRFGPGSGVFITEGISPGSYCIALDTGCVVWNGFVSIDNHLSTRPQPGQRLTVAADTGEPRPALPSEIALLDNTLILRLRVEGQRRSLEIELRSREG